MLRWLAKVLGPEGGQHGAADGLSRLRLLAAVAIVFVSAGSAVSVLKAAVYDEQSSHEDALYRQQLVSWQQANREREEQVAQDVTLFGGYEHHVLHARNLRSEALAPTVNPQLASALRAKAERELATAATLLNEFRVEPLLTSGPGAPSYDPSEAYEIIASSPQALAEDLSPRENRIAGRNARLDGVRMAGVAALFLVAVVLLTFAQVYAGARAPKAPAAGKQVPAVPRSVLRLAYALFATGTVVALVAAVIGLSVVA
ncbi:MAG TPA: hypothetical protein VF081_13490 [Solirubrobacterales bacterium]